MKISSVFILTWYLEYGAQSKRPQTKERPYSNCAACANNRKIYAVVFYLG